MDGINYFESEFHKDSPNYAIGETKSCSFIRYGKIPIGGLDLREAIIEKYRPDEMLSPDEKERLAKADEEELYVNTGRKGMKKIEVLGIEQSYTWRSDIKTSREILLESMRISELGIPGTLNSLIPQTMNLFLDKNLLYSWDQYF